MIAFSEPRAVSDAHFGRRVRARRFGRECRAGCGRPQNSFIARAKMSFRARFGLAAHRKIIARASDICLSPNISRTPPWTLQNALKMLQNAPADCCFACFFVCCSGWFDCLVVCFVGCLFVSSIWEYSGISGSVWNCLRASGSILEDLRTFGHVWGPLAYSGSIWEHLGVSGGFSSI